MNYIDQLDIEDHKVFAVENSIGILSENDYKIIRDEIEEINREKLQYSSISPVDSIPEPEKIHCIKIGSPYCEELDKKNVERCLTIFYRAIDGQEYVLERESNLFRVEGEIKINYTYLEAEEYEYL